MSNLLHAGIIRYLKSIVFRVMLLTSLILGVVFGATTDSSTQINTTTMFGIFLVIAIQISLIVGTEFSNGIVRNKLIAGHSKSKVFLSELLLSMIFSTVLFVMHYGAFIAFNAGKFSKMDLGVVAAIAVGFWLMHLSLAAICTAVSFFIPYNTAVAAVVNIILLFAMMFIVTDMRGRFDEPERTYVYLPDKDGIYYAADNGINPKYIPPDSAKYAALHAAYYIMPGGQLTDYLFVLRDLWDDRPPSEEYEKYSEDLKTAPLHSFAAIVLFSAAGLIYFRRKNLK